MALRLFRFGLSSRNPSRVILGRSGNGDGAALAFSLFSGWDFAALPGTDLSQNLTRWHSAEPTCRCKLSVPVALPLICSRASGEETQVRWLFAAGAGPLQSF